MSRTEPSINALIDPTVADGDRSDIVQELARKLQKKKNVVAHNSEEEIRKVIREEITQLNSHIFELWQDGIISKEDHDALRAIHATPALEL